MILLTILFASVTTSNANYYHIVPSANDPCPQEPCFTLSQFIGNISLHDGYNSNITLLFQPGYHSLAVELFVAAANNISMIAANVQGDDTALNFVRCFNQSARFRIQNSTLVWIKGLHFVGCGGNEINQVEHFILEDVTFLRVSSGFGRWSNSLVLHGVANGMIDRSSFSAYRGHGGAVYVADSSFSIVKSFFARNRAFFGGVVYSLNSMFNISTSYFVDNSASMGGIIYSNASVFSITNCGFVNNSGLYGGVLCAYNSSFVISTSKFTNNSNFINTTALYKASFDTVKGKGGVVYALYSWFNISASTFTHNSASLNGGVLLAYNSSFSISTSRFSHNRAGNQGGVILIWQSLLSIINSSFMANNASHSGGAIRVYQNSSMSIVVCQFSNNRASFGGAIFAEASTFDITATDFTANRASISGGALYMELSSSGGITFSKFIKNSASYGAVLFLYDNSALHIFTSTFDNNGDNSRFDNKNSSEFDRPPTEFEVICIGKPIALIIGDTITECSIHSGVIASTESFLSITSSHFTNNNATLGVIAAFKSNFSITNSTYANNQAKIGGVMSTFNASFIVSNSVFSKNRARLGGVACTIESSFSILRSNFTNNEAYLDGGVLYTVYTLQNFNITIADSTFSKNNASYGGIVYITGATVDMINGKFYQNSGSFYASNCNITFRGTTKFENCIEPSMKNVSKVSRKEGGAITSYHSRVTFRGVSTLLNNQAGDGGAILAINSDIIMWDETMISGNIATSGIGGGIYLIQCDFYIYGRCNFTQNHASVRGGGICASGSSIVVQHQGDLRFTSNSAKNGGGVYLEVSSRLVTVSTFPGILSAEGENGFVKFVGNNAENGSGGAIYIADTDSVSCHKLFSIECFIQSLAFNKLLTGTDVRMIVFSGNTATHHGSNIFGGLFNRCMPSPFATVYTDITFQPYYSGIDYLQTISNITLDSIASDPVRVCFCNSMGQPNCSYETFITIRVKKGETFHVTIAAIDQVNRSVNASIRSMLISNTHGRMGKGQQLQDISGNCTKLTYRVYSPDDSETVSLFAEGPCKDSVISRRSVTIRFLDCTCSIGFEPYPSDSECECVCNSTLSPYITKCDTSTSSVSRANTTSWITYINDTDPPGFMIHPICPLDYCYPPSENVSIDFSLPSGSDAQCAHNRSGILCGACQPNLSLSLGSSRCLPCSNLWPLAFVSITCAALMAGILLVTVISVLKMTVADGMINAIIFYANVTAPFHRIVHSSSAPNFPTVFIAWLNLDIGFDVCFFKGLDTYAKIWLRLLFPTYIIFLVAIVIKISEYSRRFTRLISSRRRDSVATLATLILLSYAKLLSTTISVLSYVTLTYPDGSTSVVWLVDGSVKYLQGKHIVLVIAVVFIILIGIPYTFFLLFWQWLIQIPKINLNRWTRLNSFITAYHAPYNDKHRYWSGLLLLVRVVLYITVATTVSSNPQIPLLMTVVLVGGLLFLKGVTGSRLYRRSSVDIVETVILLNLLLFAAFTWYNFKSDNRKETALVYVSTGIVFLLLMGEIACKIILSTGILACFKRKISADQTSAYQAGHNQLLAPLIRSPSLSTEVTHSSVEIPRPTSPPNEYGRNDFESETESSFNVDFLEPVHKAATV
jgi:predicted outer membrane repeat protein